MLVLKVELSLNTLQTLVNIEPVYVLDVWIQKINVIIERVSSI